MECEAKVSYYSLPLCMANQDYAWIERTEKCAWYMELLNLKNLEITEGNILQKADVKIGIITVEAILCL